MNKAAPWSIKGIDYDARTAAKEAARRAGMTVGEWLNSVIAEQAGELGIDPADFDDDERDRLVAEKLARLSQPRRRQSRRADRFFDRAEQRDYYDDRDEEERYSHVRRNRDREVDFESRDVRRPDHGRVDRGPMRDGPSMDQQWDRAPAANPAPAFPQYPPAAYVPNPAPAYPPNPAAAYVANPPAAFAAMDQLNNRLANIEASLKPAHNTHRDLNREPVSGPRHGPSANADQDRGLRHTLSRLEARMEALASREDRDESEEDFRQEQFRKEQFRKEQFRKEHSQADRRPRRQPPMQSAENDAPPPPPAPVAPVAPAVNDAPASANGVRSSEMARIEAKLNMLLAREAEADAEPARIEPGPSVSPARRPRARAIEEISRRQQVLDNGGAAASPRHLSASPRRDPGSSANGVVASVRSDLRTLISRIDEMRQASEDRTRPSNPPAPTLELLRVQMEEVNRAVAGLAPKESVTSLEAAVRDLSNRVRNSRQEGVRESILQPIESLIEELKRSAADRPSATDFDAMQLELQAIAQRIDQLSAHSPAAGDPRIDAIHQQTSAIRELLSKAVAQPQPSVVINHAIQALGDRIDRIASRGSSPVGSAAVAESVDEIRANLQDHLPTQALQGIQRQIELLSTKVDAAVTASPSAQRMDDMSNRLEAFQQTLMHRLRNPENDISGTTANLEALMRDIRDRLDQGGSEQRALNGAIDEQIQTLAEKIDAIQGPIDSAQLASLEQQILSLSNRIDHGVSSRHGPVGLFESQIQTLAEKIDAAQGPIESAQLAGLEQQIRSLSERMDERGAEWNALNGAIEEQIQSLSERLDQAARNPLPLNLGALEAQVRHIADRIDHPNASLDLLSDIQKSVSGVLNQLEESRLLAVDAVEAATQNALKEVMNTGAVGPHDNSETRDILSQEISGLRSMHDATDRRTHATLNAVHETLEKVVDRLAMLEDNMEPRAGSVAPPASVASNVSPPELATLASGPAPLFQKATSPAGGAAQTTPEQLYSEEEYFRDVSVAEQAPGANDPNFAAPDRNAAEVEPPRKGIEPPEPPKVRQDDQRDSQHDIQKEFELKLRQGFEFQNSDLQKLEIDDHRYDRANAQLDIREDAGDVSVGASRETLVGNQKVAQPFDDDDDLEELLEPGSGRPSRKNAGASIPIGEADDDHDDHPLSASTSFIAAARRASIAAQAKAEAAAAEAAAAQPKRRLPGFISDNSLTAAKARATAAASSLSGTLERKKNKNAKATDPYGRPIKKNGSTGRKVFLSVMLAASVAVLGTVQYIRVTSAPAEGPGVPQPKKSVAPTGAKTSAPSPIPVKPVEAKPVKAEPVKAEPVKAEPVKTKNQQGAGLQNGFSKNLGTFTRSANTLLMQPGASSVKTDNLPVASIPNKPDAASRNTTNLHAAATFGNPAAQYTLALRHLVGEGVQRDHKKAVALLEKAAAHGLPPAQYRLAALYEKGIGATKDLPKAQRLYRQAANAGNIRAMHNFAVLSAEGATGKPDFPKAAHWFRKAANHGIRDSQYNLAILYARGLGISKDLNESYKWFAIAADQGDADAGKKRDQVARRLSAAALAKGKRAVKNFKPKENIALANVVAPPAGGWTTAPDRTSKPSAPARASKPKAKRKKSRKRLRQRKKVSSL